MNRGRVLQAFQTARPLQVRVSALFFAALLALAMPDSAALAQKQTDINDALETVVGIDTRVPANARTAPTLGTRREGSGVVISDDGLVLTIGYLILEALEIDITLNSGRKVPASLVA